jgi:arsenite methyltransferase
VAQDLLHQGEIKQAVREAYSRLDSGGGLDTARRLYGPDELALVPDGAITWALGVGNPVRRAQLQPGEVVLDVGSGGGIDSILAARQVDPGGKVIGIDLLEEMINRATAHARQAGVGAWVEFRRGEMEAIPLSNDSIDVVISNGVINLSARKTRALAEIFRVLKPGGRMCVADLVVDDDLPPEVLTSDAAWAG